MHRGSSVTATGLRTIAALCGIVVGTAILVSCTASSELAPRDPSGASQQSAAPTDHPDAAPVLDAAGTAAENLPVFAAITSRVWGSEERDHGRAYIDALIAAGFAKDRMQVTADRTTVGNAVESLQFSVAWGDEDCLVGQVGPSTGDPVTVVVPQLAEGRCLIGKTRPIDW